MEVVTGTSVLVSWTSLTLPDVQGYVIYYRQTGQSKEFVTVPSSSSSARLITGLRNGLEYQFQVAGKFATDGDIITGGRNAESVIAVMIQGKWLKMTMIYEFFKLNNLTPPAPSSAPSLIGLILGGIALLGFFVLSVIFLIFAIYITR